MKERKKWEKWKKKKKKTYFQYPESIGMIHVLNPTLR